MPINDDVEPMVRHIEQSVVIRFSHIDAAGIMFYPRYFELLCQAFPELPIQAAPFAMKTEFRRSNRLGDEVRIIFDVGGPGDGWSFSGQMDQREHFSIRSLPLSDAPLVADAHRPQAHAFSASPLNVAAWATDHTGHLQVSRFFELVNFAVEQWFEEMLEIPFYELHMIRRLGIPTVEMNTRCRELPRIGDSVTMWVRPTKIGSRSLAFTSWLVRGEECLIENEQVIVFVSMSDDGFETIVIPDDVRARLEAQRVETGY